MIGRLKGILIHKAPPWIVVDVSHDSISPLPTSPCAARKGKCEAGGLP